jgi:RNA polymerase sigma factor (TIGR02999 family)
MTGTGDITLLLADFERGDSDATEKLAVLVYGHLRKQAAAYLARERPGHSLQPTLLVNEAFLRLMDGRRPSICNRSHFFALAARSMRQILVEHARKKRSAKRGGGSVVIELNEKFDYSDEKSAELLALDDALARLEVFDARQARIVEMRYFGGMTTRETATALGVGVTTIKKEWSLAIAWLRRELES